MMETITIPPQKRIFDIVASCIVIIALSPLLAVLFFLYYLEQLFVPSARGPLFYTEIRISQGRPFTLRKVRTFKKKNLAEARAENAMIHTKELESHRQNLTFVGHLLRQTYMDESPQIFSVLVGDMSFVGPRPTNPENFARDQERGLQAKKILKAGLTGRFQTHKHKKYGLNQEVVDLEYAKLCASRPGLTIIITDLYILLQTMVTVLRAEGL